MNAEVGTRNAEQKWQVDWSMTPALLFRVPTSAFRVTEGRAIGAYSAR